MTETQAPYRVRGTPTLDPNRLTWTCPRCGGVLSYALRGWARGELWSERACSTWVEA